MSSAKEIITFQIGHYSNFVGAHWWNIQESSFCYDPVEGSSQPVNHDVLFREGLNAKGEVTFTPRLISVDLKGSLRSLPQEGTLYSAGPNVSSATGKWPGEVEVQSAPPEFKNQFLKDLDSKEEALYSSNPEVQAESNGTPCNGMWNLLPKKYNLDGEVRVWSDFLSARLHPRSILLLDDYPHDSQDQQFDFFGCGTQIARRESFRDLIEDRIRNLTEECDYLQGFQLLFDGYDGFAGIASQVLLHLEEEYDQKTRICYPLFQPSYKSRGPGELRLEEAKRLYTCVLSLDNLFCSSNLFSPLSLASQGLFRTQQDTVSFPHLSYKPGLAYHTSGILAVALQTLSLPSRLKDTPTHLKDLAHCMTYGNRKLVSSHLCLPLPVIQGEPLSSLPSSAFTLQPLTPGSHSQNALIQSAVYCGIPHQPTDSQRRAGEGHPEEILSRQLSMAYPSAALFLKGVSPACKVVSPFPDIFGPRVGGNGLIQASSRPQALGVQSVPVLAAHRNSSACTQHVEDLLESAKKLNARKFHQFLETNVELDDIKEAVHNLEGFADNYKDSGFLIEG